jgi:hypothetical protein
MKENRRHIMSENGDQGKDPYLFIAQVIKAKLGKWDSIKLRSFCIAIL